MKGTYLLVMTLPEDIAIRVGKQGLIKFQKGYYTYIGSALNGLEQRIQRHLRSQKKIHWHIDYLLPHMKIIEILYKENTQKDECRIAHLFEESFSHVRGFGCSDCACQSHLFYGSVEAFHQVTVSLQMERYDFSVKNKTLV
jgi:Uri superfamily endonuclease